MSKRIPTTHPMSQLRHKKGLTLRDVKSATGISIATLSRIEQWTQFPARGSMLSLIDYYEGALCPNDFFPDGPAGLDMPHDAASDLAKPRLVQPLEEALPETETETREGEVRTAVDPSRVPELRDEVQTAYDLMTILDKAGDGIGGDVGYGVSAVALAARAALDNVRSMLKAMEASRGSRACACAREEA